MSRRLTAAAVGLLIAASLAIAPAAGRLVPATRHRPRPRH